MIKAGDRLRIYRNQRMRQARVLAIKPERFGGMIGLVRVMMPTRLLYLIGPIDAIEDCCSRLQTRTYDLKPYPRHKWSRAWSDAVQNQSPEGLPELKD